MRISNYKTLFFFFLLISAFGCAAFLFRPTQTDKFRIYFDEKLIEGKKIFLADKPEDLSKFNRPNIILILADDLGQTDISLYGNHAISTPNIDRIGREGVTFTNGYISSPICSPSRAGLMTGRYQQRFGHEFQPNVRYLKNMLEYYGFKILPRFRPLTPLKSTDVPKVEERLRQGLPPSEITIAEMLKVYDYKTAVIGKWHLGAADFALPCARGFDEQYGFYEAFTLYAEEKDTSVIGKHVPRDFMDQHEWKAASGRTGNCAILRNCNECQVEDKYLTDKLTDEGISFIDRNKNSPFFLYLPYNAPHAPLQAPKKFYRELAYIKDPIKRVYAAMIQSLDEQVGRLLDHVDSLGLSENTIIIFLSDNGGAVYNGTTDNAPYRGGKFTNFEGGIKIPFMMKWEGKINPGTILSSPVISLDIFATIASAIGIRLPADREIDGVNLMPYILSEKQNPPHETLFWRSEFNKAIIRGDWKMIVNEYDHTNQLYYIKEDSTELRNLYGEKPGKVRELQRELDAWEIQMVKPLWPRVVNYVYQDGYGKYIFAI